MTVIIIFTLLHKYYIAPTVTWTLNGKIVTETPDVRIANVPCNSKFNNDSPERKHSGTYKIVASNKWGEDEAEVEVLVVSKT